MSSFTENLYIKKQIQQLTEQNYYLKRLIMEAQDTPQVSGPENVYTPQTGGYAYPGIRDYGLTSSQSPTGYGRNQGNGNGNGTGGPLFTQGYLPPNIMNFIIRTLEAMGGDYYGLIQNGQMNWANWLLQANSNFSTFGSYVVPLLQAINGQLGAEAMQQFASAFRQWQASQSRR